MTGRVAARLVGWNRERASPYLFGEEGVGDETMRQRWRRRFRRAVERAEIVAVTIHDLRRTCLTRLALGGMPPALLKAWAGHTSTATTERYYLGIAEADVLAAGDVARTRLMRNLSGKEAET